MYCSIRVNRLFSHAYIWNVWARHGSSTHCVSPHLGGVDVGGALAVGLGEHRHDGEEDLLHRLHRAPPLRARLVAQRVVAGRVQDRDADAPVRVDVRVEDLRDEPHLRGVQRVVL